MSIHPSIDLPNPSLVQIFTVGLKWKEVEDLQINQQNKQQLPTRSGIGKSIFYVLVRWRFNMNMNMKSELIREKLKNLNLFHYDVCVYLYLLSLH